MAVTMFGDQRAVNWVGKTAAKVFKNGQDRPWDATLKEPVPQLSRLLVSD